MTARFLVAPEELRGGRLRLRGRELRHLHQVLRLRAGDRVEVFDGEGSGGVAEILSVTRSSAELTLCDEIPRSRESSLEITLAVALSKGAKLDWVVEKATELGASRIDPFVSARTVPRGENFARRVERLRRIARAAAAQCGRTTSPAVSKVTTYPEILKSGRGYDLAILCSEGGGKSLAEIRRGRARRMLVVTGPEGGFSEDERTEARRMGLAIAGLGPRILRAETAAVAAVALCQYLWGDLGGS